MIKTSLENSGFSYKAERAQWVSFYCRSNHPLAVPRRLELLQHTINRRDGNPLSPCELNEQRRLRPQQRRCASTAPLKRWVYKRNIKHPHDLRQNEATLQLRKTASTLAFCLQIVHERHDLLNTQARSIPHAKRLACILLVIGVHPTPQPPLGRKLLRIHKVVWRMCSRIAVGKHLDTGGDVHAADGLAWTDSREPTWYGRLNAEGFVHHSAEHKTFCCGVQIVDGLVGGEGIV